MSSTYNELPEAISAIADGIRSSRNRPAVLLAEAEFQLRRLPIPASARLDEACTALGRGSKVLAVEALLRLSVWVEGFAAKF